MRVFDQSFALLKIDEGMWDEIYAPVRAQTAGMGDLERGDERAHRTLDWMPTQDAMDMMLAGRHSPFLTGSDEGVSRNQYAQTIREGTGEEGFGVEDLIQSILERGYSPRKVDTSEYRNWEPPRPDYRQGSTQSEFHEGRHRLTALDEMGAPYVPMMGYYERSPVKGISAPNPHGIGDEMQRWLDQRENYNLAEYMKRGDIPAPPSFAYGRELVPGMGRLNPVMPGGDREMDIESHIGRSGNEHLMDWKKRPSWEVLHDE